MRRFSSHGLAAMTNILIGDGRLEARFIGPTPQDAPTLVLLHEGLGSAPLWGDFPDKLAAATGCGVFAYSRVDYGNSSVSTTPRRADYMHREALDVLPRVLDTIGFRRGLLIGHSDGGSIAAIYAGGVQDHRVRGISLLAPHFIVEDETIAGIVAAKSAYESGDLRRKLARWHQDVDNTFWGWNNAWLSPEFRTWDITEYLAYIRVPVQIIQGENDAYGTKRQIEIAQAECYCPVGPELLPGIGHVPHREASEATLNLVVAFVNRILISHGEA